MRSGQKTVSTAGTAVQFPSVRGEIFAFTALPTNSGTVYVGQDDTNGDVSASTGFPLTAGQSVTVAADDLSEFWADAGVNGDAVAWMRLV